MQEHSTPRDHLCAPPGQLSGLGSRRITTLRFQHSPGEQIQLHDDWRINGNACLPMGWSWTGSTQILKDIDQVSSVSRRLDASRVVSSAPPPWRFENQSLLILSVDDITRSDRFGLKLIMDVYWFGCNEDSLGQFAGGKRFQNWSEGF